MTARRLQPTEHEIQSAIMRWSDLFGATRPELRLLFAIPNGGWRHPATAAALKAEGVKPGVPDLFLPVARGGFHGLFVEVKRFTMGRVSEQQAIWAGALKAQGYRVEVARSLDDAMETITGYLEGQTIS